MCVKPKFGSDSDIKKSETNPNQKFDIRADGFPVETACNPQFGLKVTKITVLAFDVQIKNALTLKCANYFIARRQIRCYWTVTLCNRGLKQTETEFSTWYAQFIQHSSVTL